MEFQDRSTGFRMHSSLLHAFLLLWLHAYLLQSVIVSVIQFVTLVEHVASLIELFLSATGLSSLLPVIAHLTIRLHFTVRNWSYSTES